ncbi:MAG: recombinase family protein [Alphaproteobacteria bacterium]|nr:recombinase family protein [Alphaproteobacteria bacterium]
MIYAFVQDGQSIEILRQQWESLSSYAQSRALTIDKWLDSTSFNPELFKAKDVLLLEKTFRLGKDIRTITAIMQDLLQKGVVICSCEDDQKFGGDSASSKTMAHMLGVVTDIVEELRSRLTKEALTSRKLAGQKLGRPRGRKNNNHKLDVKKNEIRKLLQSGKTEPEICRLLNIPRSSLFVYVKDHPELKPEVANA